MTLHQFLFQSQVCLFQIKVIVPIRLKFKLYAVFIEWGSRIKFVFVGRQHIITYWHFLSKISTNWHKSLIPKIVRIDWWEMFGKFSPPSQLLSFADVLGMSLSAVFFILLLPNCFLKVCSPTLFAGILTHFVPQQPLKSNGAPVSNKSAYRRFGAGTIYLHKKGIAVLPTTWKICANAPNPFPNCRPMPLKNGNSNCLEAAIL